MEVYNNEKGEDKVRTGRVGIEYHTYDATNASFLETAVKSLRARVEVCNVLDIGDLPKIIVRENGEREVLLRPYQCDIKEIVFGANVNVRRTANNLLIVEQIEQDNRAVYTFLNIRSH